MINRENNSGRVFIVGAGFSNYLSDGHFPTMMTLSAEIKAKFPWINKYQSKSNPSDIESIFSQLDLNIMSEKNESSKKSLLKEKETIIQYISFRLNTENVLSQKLPEIGTQCMSFIQPGDYILTFNWDCLLEKIFWEAGIWSPYDGYGYSLSMNQNSSFYPPGKKVNPLFITILKLHGSLNFLTTTSDVGHFFLSNSPLNFEVNRKVSKYSGNQTDNSSSLPSVILPTYIKLFDGGHGYFHIWREAIEAISKAKVLCIIGYSLPYADSMARFLIAHAGSIKPISKIAIVNWVMEDCVAVQQKIRELAQINHNPFSQNATEDVDWQLIEASKESAYEKLTEQLLKWPIRDLSREIRQRASFHENLEYINRINKKEK